jgi:hypothetical protein
VTVPRLYVGVGQSDFGGGTTPNHGVKVTLKDNASNVVATGTAAADYTSGQFAGVLADADGEPYAVRGGEHLKAPAIAADVNWKIPAGISSVDPSTDKVSGQCFPNGRYEVYVLDPDTYDEALDFGEAAANGSFTKDMTPDMNVRANTYVEVDCWTPEGDIAWSYRGTYPGGFSAKQSVRQAVKHLVKRA